MGGMGVHFFRPRKTDEPHRLTFLAFFTSLFSLMIPISLILIIQVGYIHSIRENMLCYGILLFIPFFFAGVILSEVYRMFPSISAKIYGVDLVGAAAGSLGVIQLLDQLGGIRASFLLGFISSIAALLFAMGEKKKSPKGWILSAGIFLTVSFLFMANLMGFYQPDLPIGINPAKEIHDALYGSPSKGRLLKRDGALLAERICWNFPMTRIIWTSISMEQQGRQCIDLAVSLKIRVPPSITLSILSPATSLSFICGTRKEIMP